MAESSLKRIYEKLRRPAADRVSGKVRILFALRENAPVKQKPVWQDRLRRKIKYGRIRILNTVFMNQEAIMRCGRCARYKIYFKLAASWYIRSCFRRY